MAHWAVVWFHNKDKDKAIILSPEVKATTINSIKDPNIGTEPCCSIRRQEEDGLANYH